MASNSLASLRFRPSHAKQRSTTQRRLWTQKPTCQGGLRTISMAIEVAFLTRSLA